ncbi:MAG: PD-(D/E)XK nuclease family protein [Lachnospiraceae bacterium]|nr:PD-(D/E)XK nuclease family protein [Lachnospiraceae bacterium]
MQEMADRFEAEGDVVRQKEYEQVYRAVIDLMDQIHLLLGEEKISAADYLELIEAGFNEIRLGTLPQRVDRVLAGDIERTRVPQVKVLFFLGINDGNIPRSAKTGGLISDIDREFLAESGRELAPTPRQQLYIQRLYLYLNMTKPTDRLLLSYARTKQDGTAIRPSYLIGQIQTLFPDIPIVNSAETPMYRSLTGRRDTEHYLALTLRDYVDGSLDRKPAEKNALLTVYGFMADLEKHAGSSGTTELYAAGDEELYREAADDEDLYPEAAGITKLTEAAFLRYRPQALSAKTAESIYGSILKGSVTRLETAAQCYLHQYLQWGLRLKEREEFIFRPVDAGSILHDSILTFSGKIRQHGFTWSDFPADLGRQLAGEALVEKAGMYHDQLLYADARSAYNIKRLERIMERTVDTLQFQAQQGNFIPLGYEVPFGGNGELSYVIPADGGVRAAQDAQKRIELIGRIDRIDYCDTDTSVLAKVIDYKSGNKDLKEEDIRRGLQLQLMVYMEAAMQMLQQKFPGRQIDPAALLYYHFDDPVLTGKDAVLPGEKDPEPEADRIRAVRKALRPNGFVNEAQESLDNLDREFTATSLVIPVTRLKGGAGVRKSNHVFDGARFADLQESVRNKICELAGHILTGDIQANPAIINTQRTACAYCPYQDACGFDRKIAGYEYRQ